MADDIGGVWRTIGGRRVFIKDGQDLSTAMKESGKFKSNEIDKGKKIDELLAKKRKLEQEKAKLEIKEDLAKPIEKKEGKNSEDIFNSNDYNSINDEEFNRLSASQSITTDEETRIYDQRFGFIGTDYAMGINNCLRDSSLEMNFEQKKTRDTLQAVINKNKTEYDIKTTRYVNSDYLEKEFKTSISREQLPKEFKAAEKIINNNIGKVITNKGFMSVSLTDNSVFKDSVVKLNTYIKKGTNMFITKNTEESEGILNTLTKYKIIKAYTVEDDYGYNQLNIDIEVLK